MDDLSCKHRWANKGSVPWHPRESRSPCKNAVNDSTIASSISWWQGWHLFHCISPMSLQDGKKNLYRQTTVGYWFCMFVTNSLSRRTLLQINLRQLHSVPCATRYASLPAPTMPCFILHHPGLPNLTSKHHCRIDMQTEQWSSLWTYQFPHRLPHQTNQAPHVLARIH